MHPFKIYNRDNAPPPADELLGQVTDMLGFIPNVFATIAESPPALEAFVHLNQLFAQSHFDALSREIIQTAVSVENQCAYCVAGHTSFAEHQELPREVLQALRTNQAIADEKHQVLNQFSRSLVRSRGVIPHASLQEFFAAGYSPAHVLDVILGICVKTFSNLANNVIGIPLDDEFSAHQWQIIESKQSTL